MKGQHHIEDREAIQPSSNKCVFDMEKEGKVPSPEIKTEKRRPLACQIAINGAHDVGRQLDSPWNNS